MINVAQSEGSLLNQLVLVLPSLNQFHAPGGEVYKLLQRMARREVEQSFSSKEERQIGFAPFGSLVFPYFNMGRVDSLNLFDFDELILFGFYWMNRHRYHRVLDIGANLGLHSIMLDRCGFTVRAYEPDPEHYDLLRRNLERNACRAVVPIQAAVSDHQGEMPFIRLLDNTTGSHLEGSKPNPYGRMDRFAVNILPIQDVIQGTDFMKLDAEGHEKQILLATRAADWENTDAMVEIGNEDNAAVIFRHMRKLNVNLFSQKTNWMRVRTGTDMPFSHHDGSLFISKKDVMPWEESPQKVKT